MQHRSALARARGLGSAKTSSAEHWWHERLSAVLLLPLLIWLVYASLHLFSQEREVVVEWFRSPINAVGTALAFLLSYYHGALGLQVIIEDYVHCKCQKLAMLIVVRGLGLLLGVATTLAIIKLHLS